MDGKKQQGVSVSNVQSLYLNRLRATKKKVSICYGPDGQLSDAVILAFDMYTILVEAPVAIKASDRFEKRQILIYKNSVSAIVPEDSHSPIDMTRYNKGE